MKKILVFSHAGVVNVNRVLFQHLASLGLAEVRMVVPRQWKGSLIRELKFTPTSEDGVLSILALPVAISGNGSLFFYKTKLAKHFEDWVPDLVILDEEPWSLVAFQVYQSFKSQKKIFYTKQNLRKRLPPPFSWIEQYIFRHSSFAFSVAQEVTEVLHDWKHFKRPIKYLPHSYDPNLFGPVADQQRQLLREKYQIPKDRFVIAYFGRLSQEKGITDLLEAYRQISDPSLFLVLVGSGPLRTVIAQQLPSERGMFIEAIPHDQVAEAMAIVDLVVLPSRTTATWKEQFGRVLIEALGCKTALLGSDSGEIPHLIGRTGGGLVFGEGNIGELRDRILELSQQRNRTAKLASTGYDYVRDHFTHGKVASQLAIDLELV